MNYERCFTLLYHAYIAIIFLFTDVDECGLNIDDCDQMCVTNLVSYHCECYTGYFRENNSCVGKFFTTLELYMISAGRYGNIIFIVIHM